MRYVEIRTVERFMIRDVDFLPYIFHVLMGGIIVLVAVWLRS